MSKVLMAERHGSENVRQTRSARARGRHRRDERAGAIPPQNPSASRSRSSIRRRRRRSISATGSSRRRAPSPAGPIGWRWRSAAASISSSMCCTPTSRCTPAWSSRIPGSTPNTPRSSTTRSIPQPCSLTAPISFLMNDRGIERDDAVLIYDGQSRAAGDRAKTVDEALAAARSCPALYAACQQAHSKECSEDLAPLS